MRAFVEVGRPAPDRVAFHIECSSGTYVRSLVADLGDAYCEELRRTAIGPFGIDEADPDAPLPLADALDRVLPVVRIEGDDARRASHGVAVEAPGYGATLLVDDEGPIAIAEPREGVSLKPIVGFRSA